MKKGMSHFQLGALLVGLSVLFYVADFIVFKDRREIFFWLLNSMAFVFVQVLLVTLIIERVLNVRERRMMLEKLNMVIGVFFSEIGTKLLARIASIDPNIDSVRDGLIVTNKWGEEEFSAERSLISKHAFTVAAAAEDLSELKTLLLANRDFLLRLLENPVLLEHETFTELLRAVFHLTEELESRGDLSLLPKSDVSHIETDVKRAYALLMSEWLDYMMHLKENYPYLFSHAVRTNPFDRNASPIVT